jgi:PAS domain S-box-containing protein
MTRAWRRSVPWFDYGVAVGTVVLAGLVTLWLWPFMRQMPFAWLFAAVMVSGWRGGMGPGVCATALATGISLWLLFPSFAAFLAASQEELTRLAVFLVIALSMSVLNGARHDAAATLRESEAKYRLLFDSMNEGFCVVEVLGEGQDQSLDYRFLLVNPAFARLTGIPDAVGKRMRDIAPQHEDHWFTTYAQVASTGESRRFEHQAAQLQHFYDVHAFRIGAPAARTVAILFSDITACGRVSRRSSTNGIY